MPTEAERLYQKEWARRNTSRRQEINKRWSDKTRVWYKDYKANLICNRCSESHPACLQFHHTDPSQKDTAVSTAVNNWSIARILSEISKCEVLCANCHSKEHWIV